MNVRVRERLWQQINKPLVVDAHNLGFAMMKQRKKKQIPEPGKICILNGAVSPRYPEPQEHYVPYPPLAGLQPCLIIAQDEMCGALVVLPTDPPHSDPQQCPIYAWYLALIRHEFEKEIEEGRTTDVLDASAACAYEPPFRSQQVNELIEGVEKFLSAAKNYLPGNLTSAASELKRIKRRAERWTPIYHLPYEMTEGRQKNWRIIERYPEWERLGMTPRERIDEYLQYFGERLSSDKELRSLQLNAFGHRCRYLRCQCTVKAKRR
jgi:hypothetical protein